GRGRGLLEPGVPRGPLADGRDRRGGGRDGVGNLLPDRPALRDDAAGEGEDVRSGVVGRIGCSKPVVWRSGVGPRRGLLDPTYTRPVTETCRSGPGFEARPRPATQRGGTADGAHPNGGAPPGLQPPTRPPSGVGLEIG